MEITSSVADGVVEMGIKGRLDGYWADHLDKTLSETVSAWHDRVRIDLSDVAFISSVGIGVVMKYHKQLTAIHGWLIVANPSKPVKTVLDMTRLTGLLSPPDGPAARAPQIVSRPFEWAGTAFDVFNLPGGGTLQCRTIGSDSPLTRSAFAPDDCVDLRCPDSSFAIGLGGFGDGFTDCRGRFGEFLAVAGAAACLPTDGTNVADFLVSPGGEGPELRVLYGLACDGPPAWLVRFDVARAEPLPLSDLASSCLAIAQTEAVGIVFVAESAGLVGAALRRSPANDSHDGEIFTHPGIRGWLSFTAEPAFARALTLGVGVVARSGASPGQRLLRPLGAGSDLSGHVHAAAFSFRPLKKGFVDLKETVATLFHSEALLGVLHLLHDDREIVGVGQSAFIRGACWVGPITAWSTETGG